MEVRRRNAVDVGRNAVRSKEHARARPGFCPGQRSVHRTPRNGCFHVPWARGGGGGKFVLVSSIKLSSYQVLYVSFLYFGGGNGGRGYLVQAQGKVAHGALTAGTKDPPQRAHELAQIVQAHVGNGP